MPTFLKLPRKFWKWQIFNNDRDIPLSPGPPLPLLQDNLLILSNAEVSSYNVPNKIKPIHYRASVHFSKAFIILDELFRPIFKPVKIQRWTYSSKVILKTRIKAIDVRNSPSSIDDRHWRKITQAFILSLLPLFEQHLSLFAHSNTINQI